MTLEFLRVCLCVRENERDSQKFCEILNYELNGFFFAVTWPILKYFCYKSDQTKITSKKSISYTTQYLPFLSVLYLNKLPQHEHVRYDDHFICTNIYRCACSILI